MSGADEGKTPVTSEELYEQYKDALKRGHVASLRGHIEEALLCYADAARIAPERSTPHASAGTALLRRKRPLDALRHYEVALAMSPRDEAALLGRAQALGALERRGEAADAYDALADMQANAGRLADAVDAARRGLEMAEGRERRRTLERLIAKLRASEPGEPGRLALERALQVLDGSAVPAPKAVPAEALAAPSAPVAGASRPAAQAPTSGSGSPAPASASTAARPEKGSESSGRTPGAAPEIRPWAMPAVPGAIPAGATVAAYLARAEAAVEAGIAGPAVDALLDLSALHARDGRIEAALDACYSALSFDPDSVALHLALAQLYAGRGWTPLADEKLRLLERLAQLDGDRVAIAAIAGVRADLD